MVIDLNMNDFRRGIERDIHFANIHARDKACSPHEQTRRTFNEAGLG